MDAIGKKTNKKMFKRKRKTPYIKKEKPIVFGPKTRLEPWLNSSLSGRNIKKQETITNIEKDRRLVVLLDANEIKRYKDNLKKDYLNSPSTSRNGNTTNYKSISVKNENNRVLSDSDCDDEDDVKIFFEGSKQRVTKSIYWTDQEIQLLTYAFQYYGFSDMKKIAKAVETKTENDIKHYVNSRVLLSRRAKTLNYDPDKNRGRPRNCWTTVSHEALEIWPTIRKWKRLAYEQMLLYTRTKDYSRPVMSALCNKFYEEESEPQNPYCMNVKLIYKYMADCVAGTIPSNLPAKESIRYWEMLREVFKIPILFDFEEERKFLKDFKTATIFKPMQVKDEFKKRVKEEITDSNAVSVPEEIFLELSRHKRLLQSFNPLITPVWMLQKEQEQMKGFC